MTIIVLRQTTVSAIIVFVGTVLRAYRCSATGTGTASSIAVQPTAMITLAMHTMGGTGTVTLSGALWSRDVMGIKGSETTDPVVRPGPSGALWCARGRGGQILALSNSTSKMSTASGPM